MSVFVEVYKIVMRIPKGRVLTYGLISNMLNGRLTAQGVGWALKALPNGAEYHSDNVPWQRVVNAQGGVSTHKIVEMPPRLQRTMLEAEGVAFGEDERMLLKDYLWMEGLSEFSIEMVPGRAIKTTKATRTIETNKTTTAKQMEQTKRTNQAKHMKATKPAKPTKATQPLRATKR